MIHRRLFLAQLAAIPAGLSAALASENTLSGLDREADQLLREEPFFDTAASDRFFRYPGEKPLHFDPAGILPFTGGAVLGIGHLTSEPPIGTVIERELEKPGEIDVLSAWDGPGNVEQILREYECLHRTVEAHADKVAIARTADEMVAIRQAGKLALVPGLDTGNETNGDPYVLGILYRLGMRKMAMVHGAVTPFSGSGVSEFKTTPGLSPLGREMVAECNRLGVMVDISHSSDLTFWGVIECARRPILATHSGARAVAFARRNMSDEMIRAVVKNGGMIGIGADLNMQAWQALWDAGYYKAWVRVSRWLRRKYSDGEELAEAFKTPAKLREAEKALGMPNGLPGAELETTLMDPESTLKHLDYLTNLIGFDHLGIGTDLVMNSPQYPGMIRGVAAGLLRRNWGRDRIRKLFRTNLLRVFRENEGTA